MKLKVLLRVAGLLSLFAMAGCDQLTGAKTAGGDAIPVYPIPQIDG